jgi:SAM-dependent methyltransferase
MGFDIELIRNGIHSNLDDWLAFNRVGAFESEANLALAAPFPPKDRMQITTGLTEPRDFAAHGYDILKALSEASPQPLAGFSDVLDFGVGVGRLARMFKGFRGRYTGIDVDGQNIAWVARALPYVNAVQTTPKQPLPFAGRSFDLIVSISVFSHMTERDHLFYLSELARVAKPGAIVMLTVHGERALMRAETEPRIFEMLSIPRPALAEIRARFPRPGFSFILQKGHLTSAAYEYGITFISSDYVAAEWSKTFEVLGVHSGAIHDFQDIIVLRARA